jgi:hypothetical protein
MSRALLSFIGGMGQGALAQTELNRSNARQDTQDAQRTQLFDARMDDINREKADRNALKEAGKEAVVTDAPVTLDSGSGPVAYAMPAGVDAADVAASDARQFRRAQESQGAEAPLPTIGAGKYTVNGTQYANRDTGLKAAADYNSADAVTARQIKAYQAAGKASEAAQLQASSTQGKMSALQLKTAQEAQAREGFNSKALDTFRSEGVFNGAARMMTETGAFGMAGAKFEAVPTKDGKTMEFYRMNEGGERVKVGTTSNDREGELAMVQKFLQVSPDKIVDWYTDSLKRASDAQKGEKEDARWNKTFDQNASHIKAQERNAQAQLGLAGGRLKIEQDEARYKAAVRADELKLPHAVKTAHAALEKQANSIDAALNKAMADGSYTPDSVGVQTLMNNRFTVSNQMADLINPYLPKKAGGNTGDVLGIEDTPAAPAPVAKPRPATNGTSIHQQLQQPTGMPAR